MYIILYRNFTLNLSSQLTKFSIHVHRQNETYTGGTVTGEITDVPGIGPAAGKKLATGDGDEKVTNTYQLIGKVNCNFLWCM